MTDLSCDRNHVHSPEGGMDHRIDMASYRGSDGGQQRNERVVQQTPSFAQVQSTNFHPGLRVETSTCGNHCERAEDDIIHSMGRPLCCVQQQYPAGPTEGIFIEAPPATRSLDREPGYDLQPLELSNDSQCILDISKSEDCRDPIRYIDCGRSRRETDNQPRTTEINSPPSPQGPEREGDSKNRTLGFWQLCRNDPMGPPDEVEARTPHQHTDDQCRDQRSDATLSKLQDLVDQLKEDSCGFHKPTNEIILNEKELKIFAEADISNVCPMFVDHSGLVIWFVDGQGRMFEWSRMERCLQFMGANVEEGLKKYLEDPDNMFTWHKGAWVSGKELDRRGDEMYERMVERGPIVIPGDLARWGIKKQKKQKQKQKQKQKHK